MTTKRLFTGAAVIILIIFLIATINWIGVQQNRIQGLQNDIAQLEQSLRYAIDFGLDNIRQQISDELTSQNSNVFDASYVIDDYNAAKNTAYVTVFFSLKEFNPSEEVTVILSRNQDIQSVTATNIGGKFSAKAELKIDSSSEPLFTYSVHFQTGGDTITSGEIMLLCPGSDLYGRIAVKDVMILEEQLDVNAGKETISVVVALQNHFGSNKRLKLTSCILYITFDGKIVDSIDFTDRLYIQDGYQLFDSGEPLEFSFDSSDLREGGAQTLFDVYLELTDGYGFVYR